MKHKVLAMAVIAMVLTCTFAACSSDDDAEASTPEILTSGTAQRPIDWQAPDYRKFEFTMSLQVQLGDTLANFQSKQDLMCVIINNEIRAVSGPQTTLGEVYFPLTIAGNGGEDAMTLSYYCDNLHRIFTIRNWTSFNPGIAPTGDNAIYRPRFTDYVK